jgi:hypothetical protein
LKTTFEIPREFSKIEGKYSGGEFLPNELGKLEGQLLPVTSRAGEKQLVWIQGTVCSAVNVG